MQRSVTASLAFIDLSVDRKFPVGTNMQNGLDKNPDVFPNPPQKASDLLAINNSLSGAVAKALTGDHTAQADLMNIEKKWDTAFRSYAKYVGTVANGDEAVIRLGGCVPTSSQSNPSQIPGGSKNVEVAAEKAHGVVSVTCDADAAVKAYLYIASSAAVTVIQDGNTIVLTVGTEKIYIQADTHRKMMFHNLETGLKLLISMLQLNAAGNGPLSEPQSIIPQ